MRKQEPKTQDLSNWEPRSLLHSFAPFFMNSDKEHFLEPFHESSGVSVSEDEKKIYVEAALPGISPQEIEIHLDRGILSIRAEKKEETEDKNKKFYKKAHQSFFYQVTVPGIFDETKTPEATCKNGVLKVVFNKMKENGSKRHIPVKNG